MDTFAIRKEHEVQDDLRAAQKALKHHKDSFERLRTGKFPFSVRKLCDDHQNAIVEKEKLITQLEEVIGSIERGEYNDALKKERQEQAELAATKSKATKAKKAAAAAPVRKEEKKTSPRAGGPKRGGKGGRSGYSRPQSRRTEEERELDIFYGSVERFPAHLKERLAEMETNSVYQYGDTWFFGKAAISDSSKANLLFVHERTRDGEFFLYVYEKLPGGKMRVKKFLKQGRDKRLIEDYERKIYGFGLPIADPAPQPKKNQRNYRGGGRQQEARRRS